jgi:hypothetical protein
MRMELEDEMNENDESAMSVEINCNEQKSIPYELLIPLRNGK